MRRWHQWIASTSAVMFLGGCQSISSNPKAMSVDWLIEGGLVYDGAGAEGRAVDIGVTENIISFSGDSNTANIMAKKTIDAAGLIVAPGFIDPHTHTLDDLESEDRLVRANQPYSFQGVTTVVVENDGFGTIDVAHAATKMRLTKIGTNAAFLIGFGAIRQKILGDENRAPSPAELVAMKALVKKGMCEGALGLSSGLYYAPQNFAKTEEVVALAKIVAEYDGLYDTHLRDESTYNIGVRAAVAEAIEIGEKSGVPVHISHIKALGPDVWGASADMIAMIERARTSGQNVTANQYPWEASGTRISNALVPRWALDGGLTGLRQRLGQSASRARIRAEMAESLKRRGGADKLLFTGSLGQANVGTGITLQDYAAKQNMHPLDAALSILEKGDSRVASFNMKDTDINAFASQKWVMTGSDGSTGHPRKYASFPEAYRQFVLEKKLLSMAAFIRRSSGHTADILGLSDRGYIAQDKIADIVLFDPETFRPHATYENPKVLSRGVEHLFVNGTPVILNAESTNALPGIAITRRPRTGPTSCQH
jgi:N-acyl-D-aspartate/D-glutamate deacylase